MWFGWNKKLGAITTSGEVQGYETNSGTSVSGVTVGTDGKLWYGEGNAIARMDTTGKTGPGNEFPLPGGDSGINGLVLGPDGNIWFSVAGPAAIGRITTAGEITIFPTPTLNSLPFGLAVGPDKKIWFVERNGDAVGVIPATATSGADIVEYPVGFENTGLLYITAGADSRMWFSEFNRSSLGAITTGVSPPAPPPGPAPGPGPSPGPPLWFPARPAPAGCVANRLILTDVFPQGGKTQILGVAPAAAVGKSVTIVSTWTGKPVAKVKVRGDLSFKATVPFPPRSLRFTNRANYLAKLGSARSGALKFSRRMYTTSVTAAGRSITFRGTVTRPFSKRIEPVTIRAAASCSAIASGAIVASVSLTPRAPSPRPSSCRLAPGRFEGVPARADQGPPEHPQQQDLPDVDADPGRQPHAVTAETDPRRCGGNGRRPTKRVEAVPGRPQGRPHARHARTNRRPCRPAGRPGQGAPYRLHRGT